MPIYENNCNDCGVKFEVFVFTHSDIDTKCPECGSNNTERVISSFASSGSSNGSHCRPTSRFR